MIKQIIKEQIIPIGSAPAGYELRLELGSEIKKIEGYYVQVLEASTLTPSKCKVSFSDSSRTHFEPVGLNHLIVGQDVPIKDRFFKEDPIKVAGYINAKVITNALITGSDAVIQYIFLVNTEA
jgi:hypothetical protein